MRGADIPDEELLYRRVTQLHVDQLGRATSFAFAPRAQDVDGVSLFAGSFKSVEEVLVDHEDFGVIAITAREARACGAVLERDPQDAGHVLIRLPIPKKMRRALADKAKTLHAPQDAEAADGAVGTAARERN